MILRILLAPLLLAGAWAGCLVTGPAQVTGPPTPTTGGGDVDLTLPPFELEGPTLTPLSGREGALREDDGVLIGFTLRLPPDANRTSAFVATTLNGNRTSEYLTFEPGKARTFERTLATLRGLEGVAFRVQVGPTEGEVRAPVVPWPRTGERVELDALVVTVRRWLMDTQTGETLVNATFENAGTNLTSLRAKILCSDPQGQVREEGYAEPPVPRQGEPVTLDLRLPGCPDILYGVVFTARDTQGDRVVYVRVLFVDRGWTPPGASREA